jgi:nuclear pore complex protein Nup107
MTSEAYYHSINPLATVNGQLGGGLDEAETQYTKHFLYSTSATFRQLEDLIRAISAIDEWNHLSQKLASQQDPRHAKGYKHDLEQAYSRVIDHVVPILNVPWLMNPIDDAEAADLDIIRKQYLPEILIAYNTVLSISGQFVSREILLKAMDLAALVANGNPELQSCILQTKRMSEVVDVLGISGRTILRADEMGLRSTKKGRRGQQPSGLGIWTVHRDEIVKEMERARA